MSLVTNEPSAGDRLAAIADESVRAVYRQVPDVIAARWLNLRALILDVAERNQQIAPLSEALRWGEPSFLSASGSTIRLGWKAAAPDQYALLFNCQSKLVPTFREVYSGLLEFSGSRAIIFATDQPIATEAVRHCIELALRYKQVRRLPLLGA